LATRVYGSISDGCTTHFALFFVQKKIVFESLKKL
jgi:hypothetical protein